MENCLPCKFKNENVLSNIWVHRTHNKDIEPSNCVDLRVNTKIDINDMKYIANNFKSVDTPLHTYLKPDYCLWFSRATWLYDPYHDMTNNHDEHFIGHQKAVLIKDPKNILHIKNKQELNQFVEKYLNVDGKVYIEDKFIKWNEIKKDGYYGCAFEFCKVSDIGIDDIFNDKYLWHLSFDVESLCIWDNRAFDIMYPVLISDHDN